MISVKNLTKIYKLGKKSSGKQVVALNGVNIDFPDKGLVFLLGKSGSGKSTLLNSIGGLDTFDSGEIIIKGKSSKNFKQSDFDSYRNTFIGFIFQEYNILEEFTVGKNLSLALELQGKKVNKEAVNKLLDQVDLTGYYKRKPNQLSGGQKQRVAIARALIKDPEIIMADEPTGALDSNTGKQVMDTLKKLSKTKLVIIVSHDREFAEIYGDRIIELKDGNVIRDEVKKEVIAEKTESGVSFIDNKIIHIKKGQKVTKDDFMRIGKMIMDNTANSDTIISFDEKSNENVKKTAFITDEGNREVFKTTKVEDIQRQTHDPKQFKMIKSKLRFKDSFKMGASSLKHKPIRLIFTILLSVVAFTMFGVVNTMSSFNRADSVYSTIEQLNLENVAVAKKAEYEYFPIGDNLFNKFQNENQSYNLHKVIYSDKSFYLYELKENNSYPTSVESNSTSNYNSDSTTARTRISGIMQINDNIKNEFNLNLIEGRLPQNVVADTNQNNSYYNNVKNSPEICISSNLFETIKSYYKNISTFADINGKYISIENLYFKIVGVIKDNTNIEKYKSLDGSQNSQYDNRTLYEELDTIMSFGFVNMCYVTPDAFADKLSKYEHTNVRFEPYIKGQDYYGGGSSPMFYSNTSNNSITPVYIKDNITKSSLTGNQAIIDATLLTENYQIPKDEIQAKINQGLVVSFAACYSEEGNHAFDLEVVGYTDNHNGTVIVCDEFYKENFKGADYILAKLKGNNEDKALIRYFENYKGGAFSYNIQCASTPVLDEFGGMIEIMAQVLLYVGIGLAVFSGFMLMNFISTSITYKKREIGVLRAIGARGKDVFAIFFAESFIICMINFLISAVACGIICSVINNAIVGSLGVSLTLMMYGLKQVLFMLGVALGVAFIATFLPVFRFARKNPIDSINNR